MNEDVQTACEQLEKLLGQYKWFRGATVEIDDGGAHIVLRVTSKAAMQADFLVMPYTQSRVCLIAIGEPKQ